MVHLQILLVASHGHHIELFCSLCTSCQVIKDSTQRPTGLLHTLLIPDQPWQSIGMDFHGPIASIDGNDYLLVVIDCLIVAGTTWYL